MPIEGISLRSMMHSFCHPASLFTPFWYVLSNIMLRKPPSIKTKIMHSRNELIHFICLTFVKSNNFYVYFKYVTHKNIRSLPNHFCKFLFSCTVWLPVIFVPYLPLPILSRWIKRMWSRLRSKIIFRFCLQCFSKAF